MQLRLTMKDYSTVMGNGLTRNSININLLHIIQKKINFLK